MLSKNLLIILFLLLIFFAAILLLAFRFLFGGFNKGSEDYNKELILGGKVFHVEIASSTMDKITGLSGRDSLGGDEGMLFTYDNPGSYGFWMKGMKFPIDIIWINGDKIAGFAESAQPEPGKSLWGLKIYYPPESIDKVLEVNAGTVKSLGIKVGDGLKIND